MVGRAGPGPDPSAAELSCLSGYNARLVPAPLRGATIRMLFTVSHRTSAVAAFVLLCWGGMAWAQSAAQMQLFNQLPASEKQKLLGQLGVGSSGSGGANTIQPAPPLMQPAAAEAIAPTRVEARPPATPADLLPFGYDLFRASPTTFAPVSDAPVPADYVLGPGDNLQLSLFGKESGSYTLTVDRTGKVFPPNLEPVAVAGMRFAEAREVLLRLISESRLGVKAVLAMGELRSMRVFVAGDARNPGSYTVSGLATMTQALYVSGGLKDIGSLRRVQLRRSGELVAELDLYDLLLRGDSSDDARLQAGDVVFIPPVGKTVGIYGSVRRPAIYELRAESSVEELLALAGGLKPGAVLDRVIVERLNNGQRTLLAAKASASGLDLRSGDTVRILEPVAEAQGGLMLHGPARWPGAYAVGSKARVSDVLRSADDLEPLTDLDFALILRRAADGASLEPVYLNPRRVFAGQIEADIPLQAGDELHVFRANVSSASEQAAAADELTLAEQRLAKSLGLSETELAAQKRASSMEAAEADAVAAKSSETGAAAAPAEPPESAKPLSRERRAPVSTPNRLDRMQEIVGRLRSLSRQEAPAPVVDVVGAVRFPGEVPLDSRRNSVPDVLRAAGGLAEFAETGFVEISRAPARSGSGMAQRMIARVDSAELSTVRLYPGDTVAVRSVPGAADDRTVSILGEVLYPGSYRVAEGTTLASLVARAGGITASGFARGAVFTREDLRRKEEEQVQRLRDRLRGDLAAATLTKAATSPQAAAGLQTLSGLFEELAQYQALGRLVIDLGSQLDGSSIPVKLEDGDTLIIPKIPEEVTVIGEVQFPTSHRWEQGSRSHSYLARSGGFTTLADESRTFIVRADGSVESANGGWFRRAPTMQPGDVIVVPLDATPIEPLTLFSSITQIIYQLALTVAAFNSVGAF